MNIIEKFGIEPITSFNLYDSDDPEGWDCSNTSGVREVEQQRNELLNLSILLAKELEKYYEMMPGYTSKEFNYSDDFEEATGKSWEEIKELLE